MLLSASPFFVNDSRPLFVFYLYFALYLYFEAPNGPAVLAMARTSIGMSIRINVFPSRLRFSLRPIKTINDAGHSHSEKTG
jgi:hypothetical protein